jgi:large subunit ribosomal protein L17
MRHRRKGNKLGRTQSHRKALIRNLANQVIEHKEIRTTLAKAKEARRTVERLITYAKKGTLHHRRLAFSFLRNKETVSLLFDEIADSYSDRQGGYTRIYKLGKRNGDAADISILQLVGFEKLGTTKKKAQKKKEKEQTAKTEAEPKKKDKKKKAKAKETIAEAEVVETTPAKKKAEPAAEKQAETPAETAEEKSQTQSEAETEANKP